MTVDQLKKRHARDVQDSMAGALKPYERVDSVLELEHHSLELMINQLSQAVRALNKLQALNELGRGK